MTIQMTNLADNMNVTMAVLNSGSLIIGAVELEEAKM